MKLVKISTYTEPKPDSIRTDDSFYWVRLGNCKRVKFKSRRNAVAFLSETSEFLLEQLVELNFLYDESFTEYRRTWFHFSGRTADSDESMKEFERKVRTARDTVQYMFDNIYRTNYIQSTEYPFN
jgi:hypothetical protein